MQRYGMEIKVKPEKLEEYKKLHADVWPDVLKMIKECHIENYSIYYKDGFLFSYYEYTGNDYEADMAKMAADPVTQKWWDVCMPCQQPLETRKEGEWWADPIIGKSGLITTLVKSDGIVEISSEKEGISQGEFVPVLASK